MIRKAYEVDGIFISYSENIEEIILNSHMTTMSISHELIGDFIKALNLAHADLKEAMNDKR